MYANAHFPNLKRYRIDWNGNDFEDSQDLIKGDEESGGIAILSKAIEPRQWGVFPSGVHSLYARRERVAWNPAAVHPPNEEVWDREIIEAVRCEGVTVDNVTAPVVVIADVHAASKTEVAINTAFLRHTEYKNSEPLTDSISFVDLLKTYFELSDSSFPEVAIWLVQHDGPTNFFRPEIVFERRADRDPEKSAQRADKQNRTFWKDDRRQLGDDLTLVTLDLTRLFGRAITKIMKRLHSH
jgi:hypothetical protein